MDPRAIGVNSIYLVATAIITRGAAAGCVAAYGTLPEATWRERNREPVGEIRSERLRDRPTVRQGKAHVGPLGGRRVVDEPLRRQVRKHVALAVGDAGQPADPRVRYGRYGLVGVGRDERGFQRAQLPRDAEPSDTSASTLAAGSEFYRSATCSVNYATSEARRGLLFDRYGSPRAGCSVDFFAALLTFLGSKVRRRMSCVCGFSTVSDSTTTAESRQ